MEKRDFIKTASILTIGLLVNPRSLFASPIVSDIGVHLPGDHPSISLDSRQLTKLSDIERYYYTSTPKLMASSPTEAVQIKQTHSNFKLYPKSYARNGFLKTHSDPHIKRKMQEHRKLGTTPAFAHLSKAKDYTFERFCDASLKCIADDGSITIRPLDGRPDQQTYIVEQPLAYLMLNPTWYCVGLPSAMAEEIPIDYDLKKKIYQKTGLSTNLSGYMRQSFAYYGSSVCEQGLAGGAVYHNIVYNTDEALTKYYEWTDLEGCGDPKLLQCKTLKVK